MQHALDGATGVSLGRWIWRQTWLDLRSGALRLVITAVMLAVAALSSVGFFADRLHAGLQRNAAQLIGGDLVVLADQPLDPVFRQRAQQAGLTVSESASFPSMARADDAQGGAARLVALKAVDTRYPLRGSLDILPEGAAASQSVQRGPGAGEVWAEPALLDVLQVQVGQTLWLGDRSFKVSAVLLQEPDRGAGFSNFAPRLMMALSDLPATGLVQPASRITYRLALRATDGQQGVVTAYANWAKATMEARQWAGMRIESLESGRPEMRQVMARAEKFLNLVALLAALLAAVAVAVAARDFASRRLDDCAMLRVLGMSQRRMTWAYVGEFFLLGLVAGVLGVVAGSVVHLGFVALLGRLLPVELPAPGLQPALTGLGVGLALLMGFGLPTVLQLAKVPPLRVMRRDMGGLRASAVLTTLAGVLALAALLMRVADDLWLGALTVGGFVLAVLAFAGAAALMLGVLRLWMRRRVAAAVLPGAWGMALQQMVARPGLLVAQVSALSLGLMALVLLVLLRTDLVDSWRKATPPDAPDRFVLNIQPDQADAYRAQLRQAGVQGDDWYPMIRGRLVTVNGEPTKTRYRGNEQAQRSLNRELNLSHAAQMPSHNRLVQGAWAAEGAQGRLGVSVEEGLFKSLGLTLGDVLRFDVGGQVLEAEVSSVRKVEWGSMRANFFMMFPRAQLPDLPSTYLSVFRSPASGTLDRSLLQAFPNLTVVDVSASIAQVQGVLGQVIGAVELLFGFTLAAGLLVLMGTLSVSREARVRDAAVMRALGASAVWLGRVQRIEMACLGALAGLLSALAASGLAWGLARYVFEFNWVIPWWAPVGGVLSGAGLALWAGWWGLRDVLRRPVMLTLRQATAE